MSCSGPVPGAPPASPSPAGSSLGAAAAPGLPKLQLPRPCLSTARWITGRCMTKLSTCSSLDSSEKGFTRTCRRSSDSMRGSSAQSALENATWPTVSWVRGRIDSETSPSMVRSRPVWAFTCWAIWSL